MLVVDRWLLVEKTRRSLNLIILFILSKMAVGRMRAGRSLPLQRYTLENWTLDIEY
jgi:hypothetical protein